MVRAIAFGTFSLIHPGHIYYLTTAKSLADELIVVIARDSTVKKIKGKSLVPEEQRKKVIEALKPVDQAILGSETDRYEIIEKLKPDVIVLGVDQDEQEDKLAYELSKRGLKSKIVRVSKAEGILYKSSKLLDYVCSISSKEEE